MTLPSALARWDEIVRRTAGADLALFLDYDGTLAPIASRPELATLPEATRAVLARAAARFPVAVLSGRDREDVAARVGLPGLVYAGCHGFDIGGIGGPGLTLAVGEGIPPRLAAAAARLRREIGDLPGVLIEDKRFAVAVHHRLARAEDRPAIERAVAAAAADPKLKKTSGRMLFELRPNLPWDKGRAALWLLDHWGSERSISGAGGPDLLPLYLGDDLTDEDAFRALAGRGIAIRVGEAPDLPRATAAAYALADPGEVRELLDRLAGGVTGAG